MEGEWFLVKSDLDSFTLSPIMTSLSAFECTQSMRWAMTRTALLTGKGSRLNDTARRSVLVSR